MAALGLERKVWMGVLAKAPLELLEHQLEQLVVTIGKWPAYTFLRSPETGLTMVRGRAGGTGQPFNLGEMTLTRCVVQLKAEGRRQKAEEASTQPSKLPHPITGFGYVAGRSHRHAELAAFCDALMQHPDWRAIVQSQVIEPLQAAAVEKRATEAAEAESTRVNFFTMLRGESG